MPAAAAVVPTTVGPAADVPAFVRPVAVQAAMGPAAVVHDSAVAGHAVAVLIVVGSVAGLPAVYVLTAFVRDAAHAAVAVHAAPAVAGLLAGAPAAGMLWLLEHSLMLMLQELWMWLPRHGHWLHLL